MNQILCPTRGFETYGLIRKAAEMAEFGTFSYAAQQIPESELSQFFADQRDLSAVEIRQDGYQT
jgi:hypothetical protein